MNRNTLEYKIALVCIYATSSDQGDITEKEMNKLTEILSSIYKSLEINVEVETFLSDCFEDYNILDENETTELVTASILNLGESLSKEKIVALYNGIIDIIGADNIALDEREVLRTLENTWGLDK